MHTDINSNNTLSTHTDLNKTMKQVWHSIPVFISEVKKEIAQTRNIFKKDIRRLSNTDDKRNQIRWFRRGRNTLGPL